MHALWQQTKVASSTWTMLGVVFYLACVSTLQTASTAIMQFTAFNSTSTIPIQSEMAWPNATVITDGSQWEGSFQGLPPSSFLSNIQTIGLLNNTLYDILTTTDSSFTTAIVNATSLQSNCGLLSNLTFSILGQQNLSFFDNGIGSGYFLLNGSSSSKLEFFTLKITCCELLMAHHNLDSISEVASVVGPVTKNQIALLSNYTLSNFVCLPLQ